MGLLQWYDKVHRILPWRLNRLSLHQPQNALDQLTEQEMLYKVWVRGPREWAALKMLASFKESATEAQRLKGHVL